MTKNINFVSHKKSKVKLENGKPQLPSASALVEGEIAINYAKDVETLSIKNESGTVVTFSSDNYFKNQYLAWEKGTELGSAKIIGNSGITSGNFAISEGCRTVASGHSTHAEGNQTSATSIYSHAEGFATLASGSYGSHAEGQGTSATSMNSHAEGQNTLASGASSHAEGESTIASGSYSHAEGQNTLASAMGGHAEGHATSATTNSMPGVHAEGFQTKASDGGAHAEGISTSAIGQGSHAEGSGTTAYTTASHVEGHNTRTYGIAAHAEGSGSNAISDQSHAEGIDTTAQGKASHAEGSGTTTNGVGAHSEGQRSSATSISSHAEGAFTLASGEYSHAEGYQTSATSMYSHTEGNYTLSNNYSSHAEGTYSVASGEYSHAEGYYTIASGDSSHAEGSNTSALTDSSHAEGNTTLASGANSHAEGNSTSALTANSHAEGQNTIANGDSSHAEGSNTIASGYTSHAEGMSTEAKNAFEHASGKFNISSTESVNFGHSGNTLFSVGNGDYDSELGQVVRHNAFEIRQNGDIYLTKDGQDVKLQDKLIDANNYYTKSETSGATELTTAFAGKSNTGHTHDDRYYTESELTGSSTSVVVAKAASATTAASAAVANSVALSNVTGADDLKAIETITGTSGLLKKTAANKWSLDTNSYSTTAVAVTGATYNTTNKTIDLKNAAGTVVSTVDATAFIKDGMVSNVEVKNVASSGTCLVITFNTDAGKDAINIPISQIFDASNYYTKADLTGSSTTVVVAKASSATTAASAGSVALSNVSGADDLKAIEALTGTSGLLKKTAANTWALDTTSYSSATQVSTALGNKVDKVSGKGLSTNDYTTDEKNKLSGIAAGAEVNQNAFSNIKVGSTTVAADSKTDTLEISGSGIINITADATNDKITISASNAVTSVAGKTGAVTLAKSDVGLGNVDNTADANKTVKAATSAQTADTAKAVALSGVTNADDLKAIEALSGTSGLLKKTAANSWSLDTTSYSSATQVNTALAGKSNTGHTHDDRYYTESELTDLSTTVVVAKAASATTAASAGSVAWGNVTGKPDSYTPSAHNQASNTITAMTGYAKASTAAAIASGDTLNAAIGKLEKALDGKQPSGSYVTTGRKVSTASGLTGGGDLSANRTIGLATVGTAGTYYRVVVDEYGRVTSGNTTDANTNYYTTGLTVSTAETSNTITVKGNNSAVSGTAVLNSATTSAAGLMSKADKSKLDGVSAGAEVNQNAWSKIKINAESTTIDANTSTDTLTVSAGTFVTLTSDATNDKFTIGVSTGTSSSTLARGDHKHDSTYQAKGSYLSATTKYAGSSETGGAATSANKLNTNAGNTTTPVYFSGGVPTALSYTIAKSVPSDAKFTDTTYTFDGTYNASTNKAATVSTVTNAIGALDASLTGSAGAGKTLTAFSQTDGKVTATFGNISITKSQVSDFAHNQASNTITAMTGYAIASASGAVATSDSLNTAVGKLEKRLAILEAAIGGMTLVKLTSARYEALTTKDPNTMYIIND